MVVLSGVVDIGDPCTPIPADPLAAAGVVSGGFLRRDDLHADSGYKQPPTAAHLSSVTPTALRPSPHQHIRIYNNIVPTVTPA